ncbi:hypothetical protein LMG24235_08334 [Paraburkholderia sabiae]|nr:hypothetical protein LMG24235_08334 [Paraburkholderia sabiae]
MEFAGEGLIFVAPSKGMLLFRFASPRSDLFCHHAYIIYLRNLLATDLRELSDELRGMRRVIGLVYAIVGKQCPDRAGVFIGERHYRDVERPSREQALQRFV